jgi:DNA polymerase-1
VTILLCDSYSLFFRAHYALPAMSTTRGEPTAALYGLCVLMLKLVREQAPRGIAFALDRPGPTFRRTRYPEYKAGRARAPEPLVQQLGRLDELIAALGVPAHGADGFEADDVLATLVKSIGDEAMVVSGDRDVLQLAQGGVRILFVGARGQPHRLYDGAAVQSRFGIAASRLPSYVALVGDPSDNLEKVPGIGARTAAKLVAQYGDIAGILAHVGDIASPKVRAALSEHADRARLNEELARLRDDVPLGGALYRPLTSEAIERLRALFVELEFNSLLPRLDAITADSCS